MNSRSPLVALATIALSLSLGCFGCGMDTSATDTATSTDVTATDDGATTDAAATDDTSDATGSDDTGSSIPAEEQTDEANARRKIIIDTDTGGDDAAALILAAKNDDVDILGVTVLAGNVPVDKSANNALATLELVGSDADVYMGSSTTLDGEDRKLSGVYGEDGMGDQGLIHPTITPQEKEAVDFILETVRDNPGEVEIVTLGPATNIAKAIQEDPETMSQVKMIWSMGTTGLGHGNATPVSEYNVYFDVPAYKVMLESGVPVTIVGLDACGGDAMWTEEQFDTLSKENEIGAFVSSAFTKLRELYARNGSPATMNPDAVAMSCVLYPDFVHSAINCHASCIDADNETYGQVIFYKEGMTYDSRIEDLDYGVKLVTDVDAAGFFDRYCEAIR